MTRIVGIDEVGRGCLAGPLVVGAVALAKPINGLKDSKLLTKNSRIKLDKIIRTEALAFGLGWVSAAEIDALGLTRAETLAMKRALKFLDFNYDEIIIDGNYDFLVDNPRARALVKADNLVLAVSAASIIAKVARDNFMIKQSKKFPSYAFDKNVGYGTRVHIISLKMNGICELHRKSFQPVKLLLGQTA